MGSAGIKSAGLNTFSGLVMVSLGGKLSKIGFKAAFSLPNLNNTPTTANLLSPALCTKCTTMCEAMLSIFSSLGV